MLGWEPEKVTTYYDVDGVETGYAITTREPEFDEGDLERLLALAHFEAGVCDCGLHESMATDKSNFYTFEKKSCPVCKGLAQYQRVLADEDKRAEEQMKDQPPATPRPGDGRRLMLRQLSPMEVAARRQGRRPSP